MKMICDEDVRSIGDWQEEDGGGKRAAVLDSWRERALTLKVIANYFQ